MLQESLLVSSLRVKQSKRNCSWTDCCFKMRPKDCPKTPVTNYQLTMHNILEEQKPWGQPYLTHSNTWTVIVYWVNKSKAVNPRVTQCVLIVNFFHIDILTLLTQMSIAHLVLRINKIIRVFYIFGVGLWPLGYWDWEFESCWGHGCLSHVSIVCCQLGVSVLGISLVQRSCTKCGVSECDREDSIMRRLGLLGSVMPWYKNILFFTCSDLPWTLMKNQVESVVNAVCL
jgi:hypothetical protein